MDVLIPASVGLFPVVLAAIAGLIVMAPGTRPYINQHALDETRQHLQREGGGLHHPSTGRQG